MLTEQDESAIRPNSLYEPIRLMGLTGQPEFGSTSWTIDTGFPVGEVR